MIVILIVRAKLSFAYKRCIDCRHYRVNPKYGEEEDAEIFGKCAAFPTSPTTNQDFRYCETARSFSELCGEKAKRFEPKFTVPTKIEIKIIRNIILHQNNI
jgi:hypothetical protein